MQSPNSKYNNAPVSRLGCVVELWIPDDASDDIPHPNIPQFGVIPLVTLGKGREPPERHLQAPLHITAFAAQHRLMTSVLAKYLAKSHGID